MITFIDVGPVPTVNLFLRVPVPINGDGWQWGELARFPGVLASEYAYSAAECQSLIHSWGRVMARLLTRAEVSDRFTIAARGVVTGLCLGMREYAWCPNLREFCPQGEYLCGWRTAVKALYVKTGELIEGRRFVASQSDNLRCPERMGHAA